MQTMSVNTNDEDDDEVETYRIVTSVRGSSLNGLVSIESPIGKAELDLLSDLRGITSQIFFVQTKAAVVDKKTRLARKQNNIQILKNAGFTDAEKQYYLVDSKLKFEADQSKDIQDLADSGFPLIMALIEQGIKPNIRSIMMQKARLEFRPRIDTAVVKIETRKRMILADTSEKRKALFLI